MLWGYYSLRVPDPGHSEMGWAGRARGIPEAKLGPQWAYLSLLGARIRDLLK